jgi:hypothetical protein
MAADRSREIGLQATTSSPARSFSHALGVLHRPSELPRLLADPLD